MRKWRLNEVATFIVLGLLAGDFSGKAGQSLQDLKYRLSKQLNAYIIRNARLDTEWRETERGNLSLIQAQVDGAAFNLAFIGPDFKFPHKTEFDIASIRALFEYDYKQSLGGKE